RGARHAEQQQRPVRRQGRHGDLDDPARADVLGGWVRAGALPVFRPCGGFRSRALPVRLRRR
ncbi:hypothetical protein ACFQ7G_07440, partial [Streptomyces massasporeus]